MRIGTAAIVEDHTVEMVALMPTTLQAIMDHQCLLHWMEIISTMGFYGLDCFAFKLIGWQQTATDWLVVYQNGTGSINTGPTDKLGAG